MAETAGDRTVLHIENLRFEYTREAAWSLSVSGLSLARAEQMLLRGGSGRGKSTLLHVIAGLHDPSSGMVKVDGVDVHSLAGADRDRFRGRAIGMIFQTFNLLHGFTAAENVMAALLFSRIPRAEHHTRAVDLLKHLGIANPDADPLKMSVGQQQRVAVARAVACDPALVLADEPTASLDPENAERAMTLIQTVCGEKGAALLCVSHDTAMEGRFARVESLHDLAMEEGNVPAGAAGPPR